MRNVLSMAMLLALTVTMPAAASAETKTSPNGKVAWEAVMTDDGVSGFKMAYAKDDKTMQQVMTVCNYGVQTKDGGGWDLQLVAVSKPKKVTDSYIMLNGKRSHCSNEANEVTYLFKDNLGRKQRMVVRLYNDGIAFRYELDSLQHT